MEDKPEIIKIGGTFHYDKMDVDGGYNNRTLRVDKGLCAVDIKPVPEKIKEMFVGGQGFNLWLLWNAISGRTKWHHPENEICVASGPLGGIPGYPGAGKSSVVSISPLTEIPIDSNAGGYFGPFLKYSGFDALEIRGFGGIPTVIFIDGVENKIEFYRLNDFSGGAYATGAFLHEYFGGGNPGDVSVITTGAGARHTLMGCLNFSYYDPGRKVIHYKQAGRGGIGTVFAQKNIKAVVVRHKPVKIADLGAVHLDLLKKLIREHSDEIKKLDSRQNQMRKVGTVHLVEIMNKFGLLPVKNFQFGSDKDAHKLAAPVFAEFFDKGFDGCWAGCAMSCAHCVKNLTLTSGPRKGERVMVDGPEYETIAALGSNLGIFNPKTVMEAAYLCDDYGLDTISVGVSIGFIMECFEKGLIKKDVLGYGMKELVFGDEEGMLKTIHQMARGGDLLGRFVGQGVRNMANILSRSEYSAKPFPLNDIAMHSKGLEQSLYITTTSLAQQGGYGLAVKGAHHDEAWLIFLDQVHKRVPTFEQKADAVYWFGRWRKAFANLGLCKLPWNDVIPEGNNDTLEPAKVMKHVEMYCDLYYAVTGKKATPDDLLEMSERTHNFQRLFAFRMGHGMKNDDVMSYRAMGPATVKEYWARGEYYDGQIVDQYKVGYDLENLSTESKMTLLRIFRTVEYKKLRDAVYKRRGWMADGVPSVKTIKRLGLDFDEDLLGLLNKIGDART